MASLLAALICLAAGAAALRIWFSYSSDRAETVRIEPAGTGSSSAAGTAASADVVDIRGTFETFDGVASSIPGSWPRFRGALSDNIDTEDIRLTDRWPAGGPSRLWSVSLGEGYAGPAVWNGRVYVLDYDEQRQGDALRCFSLDDGREIWRRWYKVRVKRNHGMSRTVPAVADGVAVTIGPRCQVMCVDAISGDFKWGIDLEREYGATVPLWYTGQCPLIDRGVAVLAPGGSALMIGVDCRDGRVLWKTPNPKDWKMSHSSIIPTAFGGRQMYIYAALGGMAGVAADGEDRGAVLWETTAWNHAVVAPSPVPLPDGRLFLTAGYGVGSRMMQMAKEDDHFSVGSLFSLDRQTFACEQQTPVFYRGHLFGVLPPDAGALKQQLACMTLDGRVTWTSGRENRYGLGPFLAADGKLLVLEDGGTLSLVRANPERFELLDQAKVLNGVEAWGPMALVHGRLLVRDNRSMVCLDVSTQQ